MGIKAEVTMPNEAGMVNYVRARDDASLLRLRLNEYEKKCELVFRKLF